MAGMLVDMPKVNMRLVGIDGNIFAVGGAFRAAARRQGWTEEQADTVLRAVTKSKSYDEALGIIMDHVEDPVGGGDDDEDDDEEGDWDSHWQDDDDCDDD